MSCLDTTTRFTFYDSCLQLSLVDEMWWWYVVLKIISGSLPWFCCFCQTNPADKSLDMRYTEITFTVCVSVCVFVLRRQLVNSTRLLVEAEEL